MAEQPDNPARTDLSGGAFRNGRPYRDRTDGLCSAIAALSQPPDVRASAALEIICEDYADTQITETLDSMVDIVAVYMSSLDADQGVKFRDAVNAGVTPVAAP
jgi:hypothetical protein